MTKPIRLILAGDVNLMGVRNPSLPFSAIGGELRAADLVFANLECCLFDPPPGHPDDGYFAPPADAGNALKKSGITAVGVANNVNFGRDAIMASLARLGELGIPAVGAGKNQATAQEPLIVQHSGCRIGILQRTAVYWPEAHEATNSTPGVAVIKGHTVYHPAAPTKRRPGLPPANRPGLPPEIETSADQDSMALLTTEIRSLRERTDLVIASFHWGLFDDVLTYMTEFAHAAVNAGASIVVGHGPHDHILPVEIHKGVPIFYNLGALSFRHGPNGKTFHDWVGLLVTVEIVGGGITGLTFEFVRQNDELVIAKSPVSSETAAYDTIENSSAKLGTILTRDGNAVRVQLQKRRGLSR